MTEHAYRSMLAGSRQRSPIPLPVSPDQHGHGHGQLLVHRRIERPRLGRALPVIHPKGAVWPGAPKFVKGEAGAQEFAASPSSRSTSTQSFQLPVEASVAALNADFCKPAGVVSGATGMGVEAVAFGLGAEGLKQLAAECLSAGVGCT